MRIAMIAITTSSSISVNARLRLDFRDMERLREEGIARLHTDCRSRQLLLEPPVVIPAQGRLGEAFHELQVGPRPVVGMNEIGEMPVLEFDGEAKVEAGAHLTHFADDAPPMGDVAHVVVGHLENKEHEE